MKHSSSLNAIFDLLEPTKDKNPDNNDILQWSESGENPPSFSGDELRIFDQIEVLNSLFRSTRGNNWRLNRNWGLAIDVTKDRVSFNIS